MDVAEVILGEVPLEGDIMPEVDIIVIVEWIELGKIGEYGDNPGQEKEIEIAKVTHHLVPGQGQGLVQIEIGSDVLNAESMTTLLMKCPNLVTDNSDRESDSARSCIIALGR